MSRVAAQCWAEYTQLEKQLSGTVGEARLLPPLVRWLSRAGWIGPDTILRTEFSWYGRRVDLATLTASGIATAYELKLGSIGRALEQAAYNRLAFDRTYVVTTSQPLEENLSVASECGIGVIVVGSGSVRRVVASPVRPRDRHLRPRLLAKLKATGGQQRV